MSTEYSLPQNTTDKFVIEGKEHLKAVIEHCIEKYGNECDLNFLDVSNVIDMNGMFSDSQFNGDISNWDVSNVTDMDCMFENSQFTGDISNWDVSNVTDMGEMFKESEFTGDISNWDVSKVTNMSYLFDLSEFNGDISNWDINGDCDYEDVLACCPCTKCPSEFEEWLDEDPDEDFDEDSDEDFDEDSDEDSDEDFDEVEYTLPQNTTDKFVVEDKEHLNAVIKYCIKNYGNECNLNFLDVSNVTDMSCLFMGSEFNGDISKWDVSNVADMSSMFACRHHRKKRFCELGYDYDVITTKFNGDISNWNVSNVTNMSWMFAGGERSCIDYDRSDRDDEVLNYYIERSCFTGDLSRWEVSKVTNMDGMFAYSKFNGDIGCWDVSKVSDMTNMFLRSRFNGDISNWDMSNVQNTSYDMFYGRVELPKNTEDKFVVKDRSHLEEVIDYCIEKYGNNCDLNFLDVSKVTNMSYLFSDKKFCGCDDSDWAWNEDRGRDCRISIFKISAFNGDISNWDVSNVTNMGGMFENSQFNGDISNWDVSSVSYWCNVLKDCPCKKYPSKFDEECDYDEFDW